MHFLPEDLDMGLKKGENPPLPPAGTELFHSWEEPGFRIRARPVMLGGEHEIQFHVAELGLLGILPKQKRAKCWYLLG